MIIAYTPVIHRGYIDFFRRFGKGSALLIPNDEILSSVEYLWRDMRALSPEEVKLAIKALNIFSEIFVVDKAELTRRCSGGIEIVMPEEDISLEIQKLLPENAPIRLIPFFLRWNNWNVLREELVFWDREEDAVEIFRVALSEKDKSSDWWRQVGAMAFKREKTLLVAHNRHLPTPHEPYFSGDPRTVFRPGECIEYSTAIHAEAALVAEAAKRGLSLLGADVFVTTFPCPPCANLLSQVGIRTLYVLGGYSKLDAKRILESAGIEVVKIKNPPSS